MEEIMQSTTHPRRWLRRLGCGAGIFLLVVALLFVILVWSLYRQKNQSPTSKSAKLGFTATDVASTTPTSSAPIATDDDPSVGPKEARITIVEFSDFECPFCKQAFPIIRELMVKYGDRVRFIHRDFPITQIHDKAQKAAEAGECADEQGKFWALHDKIFQYAPAIAVSDLKRYAQETGLDTARFNACLDNAQFAAEVQQDFQDGVALGVRGTPTWFINGKKVEGVIPRESFIKLLDQLLAQ